MNWDVSSPLVLLQKAVWSKTGMGVVPTMKHSSLSTTTPPESTHRVSLETSDLVGEPPEDAQASWFFLTPSLAVDFSTLLEDIALITSKIENSLFGLIPNFSCM